MSPPIQPPLTETVYYILLAAKTPLHGYGIIQRVENLTDQRIRLGPGTLYGAIKKLLEKELIELVSEDQNTRKKEYRLTEEGISLLQEEMKRLKELQENGEKILGGDLHVND